MKSRSSFKRLVKRHLKLIGFLVATLVFIGGWWIRKSDARRALREVNTAPRDLYGSDKIGAPRFPPHPVTAPADLPADFRFTDVTKELGISFQWQEPVLDPRLKTRQRLIYIGAGAAVADFDGDGWMDILLLNGRQSAGNQLYLNRGGQGFVEVAKQWGIADLGDRIAPVTPVVFDYDNDGRPDLFVTGIGCSVLLHNTGQGFVDVSKRSGLGDCRNSPTAVPIDFDGDGFLDLYVLRYWRALNYLNLESFFTFTEDNMDSKNGGENSLYRNRGDGTFEEVTRERGGADTHWSYDGVAADLLGDGTQRIYVANDYGPDKLWAARGGKLIDESRRLGVPDRRLGMGVSIGDLDGDGLPHVHVSNDWVDNYDQHGNFLWKFDENSLARDEAIERGTLNCGWAWGSAFADFDLDGRQDLYVANGFITGNGLGSLLFPLMLTNSTPGVILSDFRNWPELGEKSVAGHEVGCLFWNRGSRFENVSPFVGLDRDWDGRAVVLVDFDNNGSMDMLVTTQNYAPANTPHLLRNGIHPGNRWISFLLVGTRSNRDAVGARLEIRQGKTRQFRWATGGRTGFLASSDPRLHFGVPDGAPVDVEIRWPSGLIQKFGKVAPGKAYTIREGESRINP